MVRRDIEHDKPAYLLFHGAADPDSMPRASLIIDLLNVDRATHDIEPFCDRLWDALG